MSPVRHGPEGAIETPPLSLVLGYGAMLPFVILAVAAWMLGGRRATWAVTGTVLWGSALLAFLGGVRRGLSFRTAGGPTFAEIATMFWLFVLALAALAAPVLPALVLLLVGYASVVALDPPAARHGEAPRFFARLRPVQMSIPIASLLAVLARVLVQR